MINYLPLLTNNFSSSAICEKKFCHVSSQVRTGLKLCDNNSVLTHVYTELILMMFDDDDDNDVCL